MESANKFPSSEEKCDDQSLNLALNNKIADSSCKIDDSSEECKKFDDSSENNEEINNSFNSDNKMNEMNNSCKYCQNKDSKIDNKLDDSLNKNTREIDDFSKNDKNKVIQNSSKDENSKNDNNVQISVQNDQNNDDNAKNQNKVINSNNDGNIKNIDNEAKDSPQVCEKLVDFSKDCQEISENILQNDKIENSSKNDTDSSEVQNNEECSSEKSEKSEKISDDNNKSVDASKNCQEGENSPEETECVDASKNYEDGEISPEEAECVDASKNYEEGEISPEEAECVDASKNYEEGEISPQEAECVDTSKNCQEGENSSKEANNCDNSPKEDNNNNSSKNSSIENNKIQDSSEKNPNIEDSPKNDNDDDCIIIIPEIIPKNIEVITITDETLFSNDSSKTKNQANSNKKIKSKFRSEISKQKRKERRRQKRVVENLKNIQISHEPQHQRSGSILQLNQRINHPNQGTNHQNPGINHQNPGINHPNQGINHQNQGNSFNQLTWANLLFNEMNNNQALFLNQTQNQQNCSNQGKNGNTKLTRKEKKKFPSEPTDNNYRNFVEKVSKISVTNEDRISSASSSGNQFKRKEQSDLSNPAKKSRIEFGKIIQEKNNSEICPRMNFTNQYPEFSTVNNVTANHQEKKFPFDRRRLGTRENEFFDSNLQENVNMVDYSNDSFRENLSNSLQHNEFSDYSQECNYSLSLSLSSASPNSFYNHYQPTTSENVDCYIQPVTFSNDWQSFIQQQEREQMLKTNKNSFLSLKKSRLSDEDLFSQDSQLIKVIVQQNFRKNGISRFQKNKISHEILMEIKNINCPPYPRFRNYYIRHGGIIVECDDEFSRDWLIDIVPNLKPWKNANLSVINLECLERYYRAIIWIPGRMERPEVILDKLEKLNSSLNTRKWRIHSQEETTTPEGFHLFLGVPNSSINSIKEMYIQPFVGMFKGFFTISRKEDHY
ncbi:putative uncharacterized protein DDB_G0282133 [Leptopilina heterotoma]|uniref:putative uncharacterized protein DDB_G0282133 n=1 Tax=Leptopilina heterotoma TaxID=63436 RepID=UPI001CA8E6A0|nr:putative uncharacterized protein DDB_G0282133 [Leptopilina heterotoma]